MLWFIPSMFGDVRLEPISEGSTKLITEKLSPAEKKAVEALLAHGAKKGWTQTSSLEGGGSLDLAAPLYTVQKTLVKAMKPGRKTISAVKFSDGKMQEVTEASYASIAAGEPAPEVGASVAAPVKGCPAPAFFEAELKAQRVLKAFLSPAQLADFGKRQSFVVTGADTGHKYAVTSRHAVAELDRYGRSLYDLTEREAICTHDWTVPPAEELLALLVFLRLPGRETWLRELPG